MNNTEEQKYVWIPGELRTDTTENIVVSTDQVFDKEFPTLEEINGKLTPSQTEIGEDQETINKYVRDKLNNISDKTPFIQNQNNGIQGQGGTAGGSNSFAIGNGTITSNLNEVALGKYNKSEDDTIFSVGIGTDNQNRKNAFEIRENGDIYFGDNINLVNLLNELSNIFIKVSNPDDEEVQGIISYFTKAAKEFYDYAVIGQGAVNLSRDGQSRGNYSLAIGNSTITNNIGEVALGQYNDSDSDTIFSIGNGTDRTHRSNIFEIRQDGIYFNKENLYNKINQLSNLDPDTINQLTEALQNIPIIKNGIGIKIENSESGNPSRIVSANLLRRNNNTDRELRITPKYYEVEADKNGNLAVYVSDNTEYVNVTVNGIDKSKNVRIVCTINEESNEFLWDGTSIPIEIPYGTEYMITASSVDGYYCDNNEYSHTFTASQPNRLIQFNYHKANITINRSSNQNSALPEGNATLKWTEGVTETEKSQLVTFPAGSNSISVNGIPLNVPITIEYEDIDGYKKPNNVVITFTPTVTTNSDDTGGGYKACKVTVTFNSNQNSDTNINNASAYVIIDNTNITIDKNNNTFLIPYDGSVILYPNNLTNYSKPNNQTILADSNEKSVSLTYSTTLCKFIFTVDSSGGKSTSDVKVIVGNTTYNNNGEVYIPSGTKIDYSLDTEILTSGYSVRYETQSGTVVSGVSKDINIYFTYNSGTKFVAKILSTLDDDNRNWSKDYLDEKVKCCLFIYDENDNNITPDHQYWDGKDVGWENSSKTYIPLNHDEEIILTPNTKIQWTFTSKANNNNKNNKEYVGYVVPLPSDIITVNSNTIYYGNYTKDGTATSKIDNGKYGVKRYTIIVTYNDSEDFDKQIHIKGTGTLNENFVDSDYTPGTPLTGYLGWNQLEDINVEIQASDIGGTYKQITTEQDSKDIIIRINYKNNFKGVYPVFDDFIIFTGNLDDLVASNWFESEFSGVYISDEENNIGFMIPKKMVSSTASVLPRGLYEEKFECPFSNLSKVAGETLEDKMRNDHLYGYEFNYYGHDVAQAVWNKASNQTITQCQREWANQNNNTGYKNTMRLISLKQITDAYTPVFNENFSAALDCPRVNSTNENVFGVYDDSKSDLDYQQTFKNSGTRHVFSINEVKDKNKTKYPINLENIVVPPSDIIRHPGNYAEYNSTNYISYDWNAGHKMYIPDCFEWYYIINNLDEINTLMETFGGDKLESTVNFTTSNVGGEYYDAGSIIKRGQGGTTIQIDHAKCIQGYVVNIGDSNNHFTLQDISGQNQTTMMVYKIGYNRACEEQLSNF